MRRYLRCPGAICCPARRALRAVLQTHIRFCDELIVVDRAEHIGELLGLVGERLGSVLKHRLQHGEHRQGDPRLLALFRLRSTGLGVADGAIRSCRGRHRPRASPQGPNGPTRARLKPPGSPAATRSNAFRPLEKKRRPVGRRRIIFLLPKLEGLSNRRLSPFHFVSDKFHIRFHFYFILSLFHNTNNM